MREIAAPDAPAVSRRSLRSGVAIIALFGLVVLSAPVGLFARAAFGEPYPWLFQPSFGYVLNKDGTVMSENPVVAAVTNEGESLIIRPADLMPESRLSGVLMFLNNFRREEVARDPRTAQWVAGRLSELYPDKQFERLTVTWANQVVVLASGDKRALPQPRVDIVDLPAKDTK